MLSYIKAFSSCVAIASCLVTADARRVDAADAVCGGTYTSVAVLTADLDCSAESLAAITLESDAILDLAGFTLTGGTNNAVLCEGDCQVRSSSPGGTISGAGANGIRGGQYGGDLRVRNVTVVGNAFDGISIPDGDLTIVDSVVSNNGGRGIYSNGVRKARMRGTTVAENGESGLETYSRTIVLDSEFVNNGAYGVLANGVTIKRSSVTGNNYGITGGSSGRIRLTDTDVQNNVGTGVSLHADPNSDRCRIKIVSSDITGNAASPDCGVTVTCADIVSCGPPVLVASQCGTSFQIGMSLPGDDWDVCLLD